MRSGALRYPVDRYLVESSNKFEMINIIDDGIWSSEPALRPEDEIILRKLHEMLQSTADDLKLLSGELSKFHEPGVQVKTAPTPLDEEFNEKVHIKELVNAKFHGYKIINRPLHIPEIKLRNDTIDGANVNRTKIQNTDVQPKRPVINRNLGISRTRIIAINGSQDSGSKILNNGKVINSAPAVAYNEFNFKYSEPKVKKTPTKLLQVQDMPSIDIRGELKHQKILQLDILPEKSGTDEVHKDKINVSVISVNHNTSTNIVDKPVQSAQYIKSNNHTVRKISKMSTCETSESTNVSSEIKENIKKRNGSVIKKYPKTSARDRVIQLTKATLRNNTDKTAQSNIDKWKRKLNMVYGTSNSKKNKNNFKRSSQKTSNVSRKSSALNSVEYIPYSQLTLGGVRLSDVEREISNIPINTDMPLSPILDRILGSKENSFIKESPRKARHKESDKILTTSDENLLQEVIDIERSVSETLSKNLKDKNEPVVEKQNTPNASDNEIDENASYADDFEDEKSEQSLNSVPSSLENIDNDQDDNASEIKNIIPDPANDSLNKTFTKSTNLAYKDSVEIFEFIHSVDTQDTATQSNGTNKITPKQTQTSPRNDKSNIQPIHNDLWPSIDPRREVEKMFELEKDFIKKLIIEEYGDMFEKTINKPSSSNETQEETKKNIASVQKNTQTSPARVKSVMTSSRITKTRTTSPLFLTIPVHQQTSPMINVTHENENSESQNKTHTIDVKVEADDISVNLSSSRFSLRLPSNSREVLHNLNQNQSNKNFMRDKPYNRTYTKSTSSSSSVEADKSSEISSIGEIRIKKKLRKRYSSISEDSSTSSTGSQLSHDIQSVSILPLRSEGEVSLGHVPGRQSKLSKSDGETSLRLAK